MFFRGQTGQKGGSLAGFSGVRYQRGAGLGSLFRGLFRTILPVVKSVGKTVGRQALATGAQVASDVLDGRNVGQSIKQRGRQGAAVLLKKGAQKLKKKTQKKKQKKKTQKGRGLGYRPKKKKKQGKPLSLTKRKRTDQLGSYFV